MILYWFSCLWTCFWLKKRYYFSDSWPRGENTKSGKALRNQVAPAVTNRLFNIQEILFTPIMYANAHTHTHMQTQRQTRTRTHTQLLVWNMLTAPHQSRWLLNENECTAGVCVWWFIFRFCLVGGLFQGMLLNLVFAVWGCDTCVCVCVCARILYVCCCVHRATFRVIGILFSPKVIPSRPSLH